MAAKHVLIVEDERPIREMIAFGLKRAGFEVREAEDCRAARAALADARPDLVLVDWMLPDMSGLELTRALKRDRETRELPVIMLTARAEEGDKAASRVVPMTTSPSPSHRASCWRASTRCCAVAHPTGSTS
jgi:two-component system phosphate regulon response regulator PhoB